MRGKPGWQRWWPLVERAVGLAVVLSLAGLWVPGIRIEHLFPTGDGIVRGTAFGRLAGPALGSTRGVALLSLNPQNPLHLLVVMPLMAALMLLPVAGAGALVWWRWLRRRGGGAEAHGDGDSLARGSRLRYVLAGLLLWLALSGLLIVDLLGSASLYPLFVAVYAAFWVLVGGVLLTNRSLGEKVLILGAFLIVVLAVRYIDWNSRKPFLRHLYRIEEGMTAQQVERIMDTYPEFVGTTAQVDEEGYPLSGIVSYTHTDEGWGSSDIGRIMFQNGRVVEMVFLPD